MTSPWTPPPAHPSATGTPTRTWGPLVGWLLVVAAAVASAGLTGGVPWATGALDGGGELVAAQEDLVSLAGYEASVVLAFAGLGAGVFLGLAAVPGSRTARWVVTGGVLALFAVAWVTAFVAEEDLGGGELVGALAVSVLPAALLLLLVWLPARRGPAWVALAAVAAGAVAHVVTLVRLLASAGTPAWGAWLMLALEVVALAGAVLLVRTTPARRRLSPARPG